jgi:hypothetical protein
MLVGKWSNGQKNTMNKNMDVITSTANKQTSPALKKEIQRPMHIGAGEFVHWLAPDSHIDEDSLRSLFKL